MNKPMPRAQHRAYGTWVFGSLFFVFFVGVFVFAPETLPVFKQRMFAIASALLAGLFGYFLSGDIGLEIQSIKSRFGEVGVKATGGIAAFVLVLVWWLSPWAPVDTTAAVPAVPEVTATDYGIGVGGDMVGSAAVTGDHNVVAVTWIEGISPETNQALAKQLGITEAALTSFFKILERKQVPPEDLDSTLRTIATRYKELDQMLATFTSEDPAVVTLKRAAREALEAGEFARTEALLNEAKEKDIATAKEMQETAHKRLLSAAESAAELGALKDTELEYAEAATYYREAAELVPDGGAADGDSVEQRGRYLQQAGRAHWLAGQYSQAADLLERHCVTSKECLVRSTSILEYVSIALALL